MPLLQQLVGNGYPVPSIPLQQPHFRTQTQASTPYWSANPGVLLSGVRMTIPVALQQAILDHMISLSPYNPLSNQLSQLVGLVAGQQQQLENIASTSAPQSNTILSSAAPSISQVAALMSTQEGSAPTSVPQIKVEKSHLSQRRPSRNTSPHLLSASTSLKRTSSPS